MDKDGKTLVVYHGTNAEFYVFQKGHTRTRGNLNFGEGYYFTSSRSMAENYADGESGRVMETYVAIRNPYTVYWSTFDQSDFDAIAKKLGDGIVVTSKNVTQCLQRLGYDGVIERTNNGADNPIRTVVAFKSAQIKSASDNIGTYDGGNDNILHSDPEDDIDNRTFSYSELVAKGEVEGVIVGNQQQAPLTPDGKIDTNKLLSIVRSKCSEREKKGATTAHYVSVKDIGKNVEIIRDGVLHRFIKAKKKVGPRTRNELFENARVTLELPQILSKAIEVNRSARGNNPDVPYTHVLMGTAALEDHKGGLEYFAVRFMVQERLNQPPYLSEMEIVGRLTSTNAKKIDRPTGQGITPLTSGAAYIYIYSVTDFLQDVKGVFDDTFSLDVYNHLGAQRAASEFSQYLLHSDPEDDVKSDREILASLLMEAAKNPIERDALAEYQKRARRKSCLCRGFSETIDQSAGAFDLWAQALSDDPAGEGRNLSDVENGRGEMGVDDVYEGEQERNGARDQGRSEQNYQIDNDEVERKMQKSQRPTQNYYQAV